MKPLKRRAALLALILWAIVGIAVVVALGAKAQEDECQDPRKKSELLAARYGEYPESGGQISTGAAIIVYVNPETRSWTMIVRPPGAPIACPVLAGEGWETLPEQEKPSH